MTEQVKRSIFDEVQARYRSDPHSDEGGRFGAVNFDNQGKIDFEGMKLRYWEKRIEERDRRDVGRAVLDAHRAAGINIENPRNSHR